MTGERLITALRRTQAPIIFAREGFAPLRITSAMALAMAATGLYTGVGTKRKINILALTPPVEPKRPELPWQECWRTNGGSAMMSPSAEYWRNVQSPAGVLAA